MPLLVVSIMSQLVFRGGMIPVTGRLLDQLSWFTPGAGVLPPGRRRSTSRASSRFRKSRPTIRCGSTRSTSTSSIWACSRCCRCSTPATFGGISGLNAEARPRCEWLWSVAVPRPGGRRLSAGQGEIHFVEGRWPQPALCKDRAQHAALTKYTVPQHCPFELAIAKSRCRSVPTGKLTPPKSQSLNTMRSVCSLLRSSSRKSRPTISRSAPLLSQRDQPPGRCQAG